MSEHSKYRTKLVSLTVIDAKVSYIPLISIVIAGDLEKEQEAHNGTKDELAAVNAEIDDI